MSAAFGRAEKNLLFIPKYFHDSPFAMQAVSATGLPDQPDLAWWGGDTTVHPVSQQWNQFFDKKNSRESLVTGSRESGC
jgi:hypothetical protein